MASAPGIDTLDWNYKSSDGSIHKVRVAGLPAAAAAKTKYVLFAYDTTLSATEPNWTFESDSVGRRRGRMVLAPTPEATNAKLQEMVSKGMLSPLSDEEAKIAAAHEGGPATMWSPLTPANFGNGRRRRHTKKSKRRARKTRRRNK